MKGDNKAAKSSTAKKAVKEGSVKTGSPLTKAERCINALHEAERKEAAQLEVEVNRVVQERILKACAELGVSTTDVDVKFARSAARKHCKKKGITVPAELNEEYTYIKLEVRRVLEDGTIEDTKPAGQTEQQPPESTKGLESPLTALSTTDHTDSKLKKRKAEHGPSDKKSSKQKDKAGDEPAAPPAKKSKTAPHTTSTAENWNANALTGDEARREKFRRLLGAGKSKSGTEGAGAATGKTAADISKMERELEQQFDAGVRMKHEQGAKRRGLGA